MDRSRLIVTDSGGVQEEAPSLGKPVLVMREVTERPEAVESGAVQLVGTDPDRIVAETVRLLEDVEYYESVVRVRNVYGDGLAGERISRLLADPSAEVTPWVPTETDQAIKRTIR
jgi:UDP-N-acetylglucosamine 2-epimerase